MSIPASQLAQAIPGVLGGSGANLSLTALLVSQSAYTPVGGYLAFSSAQAVGQYYGFQSPEYEFAQIYFQGINNALALPAQMFVVQYPPAAVGAWLRGGSTTSLSLTQLQALSGTLTISVNGVPETSSTISLSAATSFSNAASLIQAGFTSPGFTVTYDAQHSAFLFTNTTTGATSVLSFASSTTGNLASQLFLTQATGALLSPGAAAATVATFMPTVPNLVANWASFTTTWEPVLADKIAFSAWTNSTNGQYGFIGYDSDINNTETGTTETWGYQIGDNGSNYNGTVPIYGNLTHAALGCSWAACLNFNQPNGRTDLAGVSQTGVIPYVTSGQIATTLIANGMNFYGQYATRTQQYQLFQNGSVSGPFEWADSYFNQIRLNSDLQDDAMQLLSTAKSIPYNTEGQAMIEAAFADTIQAHLSFGTIRTGVTLSASQIQDLYAVIGADVSALIEQQGWYIQIVPATPTQRQNRTSPTINFWYTDGGDIQQIVVNSTEIQ